MRTGAILILILFMLNLLIPASSADNQTNHNHITTLAPEEKSGPATAWTQSPMTETKKGTKENVITQNDTTPGSTSATLPSSTVELHFPASNQPDQFSPTVPTKNTTRPPTKAKPSNSKFMLFVILLAIVVLMLFAGCLHAMRDRDSSQDSSVSRFLVGVRKRLRDAIGYLQDRMGLRLWPVGMTGGEDDDEEEGGEGKLEEEGEQRRDNRGEGGSRGVKNEEKVEQKEEDDSLDNSSMDSNNLREVALSRQVEEEKKQIENEDGDETTSESEGDQSALEGQSSGDKKGGSEEMALVKPLQENDQREDFCDVTVL